VTDGISSRLFLALYRYGSGAEPGIAAIGLDLRKDVIWLPAEELASFRYFEAVCVEGYG